MNWKTLISTLRAMMPKVLLILFMGLAVACGKNSERTSEDMTDENVSPNQTQTEEEARHRDSVSGDVTKTDTASDVQPSNGSPNTSQDTVRQQGE